METQEIKIEIEKKAFTIFGSIMIILICTAIYLIQLSDSDRVMDRAKQKQELIAKEKESSNALNNIYTKVVEGTDKVSGLTQEVHQYRNDVQKNIKTQEKSLNNFNQLKKQDEKNYIPTATIDEQAAFISKYRYEPFRPN